MFREQFGFGLPAIVNFVGGGGKTGLILALLREYAPSVPVIYSTTTRIHPPHPSDGLINLACEDPGLLGTLVDRIGRQPLPRPGSLVVTCGRIGPELLRGVPASFFRDLDPELYPLILNEADGARGMSLKMPRDTEPVLMEGARYLVPVIGMDVLGKALGPATLFRWEMAAERFSLREGEVIQPELAARLLLHPQGVCKGWRSGTQIIPFINKADTPDLDGAALALAHALLAGGTFPVDRVVWGSLHSRRCAFVVMQRE
ncbi:MAG: putative selenium-dependent hydroxylase accessory protein YqeC [Acidobacteria bacterium]|nr:putative selenium-dependent hydroxylase accessory protein YqeC [Acidobacteriota bacterium]